MCLFCIPIFVFAEEKKENLEEDFNQVEKNDKDLNNGLELASNAKSAIMIETSTGKIIYEKNVDEKLPMASMTKMMTYYLLWRI